MRTPLRIALLVVATLCALASFSACKKSEPASHGSEPTDAHAQNGGDATHGDAGSPASHEADTPDATSILHDEDGVELVQFEAELLLSDAYTMSYMVVLPPEEERALLIHTKRSSGREERVRVRLAVECASEVAYEELHARAKFMGRAVEVPFETRTAAECRTLEGKLRIKEDIIQELQERMKRSKGIKQVYFLEYRFF
jgi:flagellar basal body-associated protein FliL